MAASPVVTLRIPADRLERINLRAKASGLSRSQYMIDRADPEGSVPRATTPRDMTRPAVACTHPRDRRQVFSWGSICSKCGTKVG